MSEKKIDRVDLEELNSWIMEALGSYSVSDVTFRLIRERFEKLIDEVEPLRVKADTAQLAMDLLKSDIEELHTENTKLRTKADKLDKRNLDQGAEINKLVEEAIEVRDKLKMKLGELNGEVESLTRELKKSNSKSNSPSPRRLQIHRDKN